MNHPGLQAFLLRAQLAPGASGTGGASGALVLVVDAHLRVQVHPAGSGDVVLEAQICLLPPDAGFLEDALRVAATRPLTACDALVLGRGGDRLLLQQRVCADAGVDEFETAFGDFLHALTQWRVLAGVL